MISFLNRATTSISAAALILGSAALVSRVLGLVRDRVLAGALGAGPEYDAYLAAFRIPDLLYNVVLGGAISAAFVPVFISYLGKDTREAWAAARSFFYVAIGVTVLLSAVLFAIMPFLTPLIVPGFDAHARDIVTTLSRIMLLSPIFLGASAVLSGILHSVRKFFIYSLAPIFYNLGIIFGVFVLLPPWGLVGLAWGVALGAFLHLAIQAPTSFSSGFSIAWPGRLLHPAVFRIMRLMVPRALGLAAYQVNLIVVTAIASTLAAGSLAIFTLANHIQYLPIGIVGISFAIAAFPNLSQLYATKQHREYLKEFSRTFRNVLFLVAPASTLIFVLRIYIVRIAYGTGAFDWEDTRLTAAALGAFSAGIFAYTLAPLLSRAFYAQENTKTPVIANTVGVAVNVALSFLLIFVIFPRDGVLLAIARVLKVDDLSSVAVIGLPVAFSVAGIVAFVLLITAFFKDSRNRVLIPEFVSAFFRIGVASIATGFAAWVMLQVFQVFGTLNTFTVVRIGLQAGWAFAVALVVYIAIAFIFRFEELNVLGEFVHTRLRKTKLPSDKGPTHPDEISGP